MEIETATEKSMQDNANDLEALLYPDAPEDEPEVIDDDEVSEDALELPEDDDSESDDDEGSEDEVVEEDEGEMTLADFLGIDEERLIETEDGFAVNAIIDGETKQVPLTDLIADYQLKSHVNNKSIALENERKEFDAVKTQVATELKARAEGVTSLASMMEEQLVGEFNRIDWDKLRVEDPANWSALRQDYAERAQKIQNVQTLAKEEQARVDVEQQERYADQLKGYLAEQSQLLITKNPNWADEGKRQADLDVLSSFVTQTYGFSDQELEQVSDHRLIAILQDAQKYRSGKESAETKRVNKKLPKFQKPGGNRQNAANLAKARKVKALKARRKSTGSINDIAASIVDRM